MNTESDQRDHAVVIGASVAGLMAAGAASASFGSVTLLERDELPDTPVARKGVAQGSQIHVILPIGLDYMEEVFPGIRQQFLDAGCNTYDELADVPVLTSSGWRLRVPSTDGVGFRRPLLESIMRRELLKRPNVEIRHASVKGLTASDDRSRITGVTLRNGDQLAADLVVNATGRRTKALEWLTDLGFQPPAESFVNAYMGYATQFVKVPDDAFEGSARGIVATPWPGRHEGAALLPADNGVYALTAVGMVKSYPSRDREEFLKFLDAGPAPQIARIARLSEPVSEINTYHQEGTLLRRWDEASGLPDRFLAVGDSVVSLNPIYGQGMTLSAAAGAYLQQALTKSATLDGLGAQVQKEIATIVNAAYELTAGADAIFEGVECSDDYPLPTDEDKAFGEALEVLSTQDPDVALTVALATYYIKPELLEAPELLAKVDAWRANPTRPQVDPEDYPKVIHESGIKEPAHA